MSEEAKGKRLYVVTENNDAYAGDPKRSQERLIEAGSPAQAIRIAASGQFSAKPASPYDVARIMAPEPKEA